MKRKLITLANSLAVFAALLALWQLVLWVFRVPPFMLPSPWAVTRAVGRRLPSLGAANALPLHFAAADGTDRCDCAFDSHVGGRGHGFRHADRLYHFAGADYRQHYARTGKRRREHGAPFSDA